MKIEVGKEYITASGERQEIISKSNHKVYPFYDKNDCCYCENGQCLKYRINKHDLICEIVPSIYALYKSGIIDLKELIKQHIEYYTK